MKGTTPTHVFKLPCSVSLLKNCTITYSQNGEEKIKKYLRDCKVRDNKIIVRLEQYETLTLEDNIITEAQLKLLFKNGAVVPSDVIRLTPNKILDTEVLR